MNRTGAIILGIVAIVAIAFGAYMIDFDVADEGALPDVSVNVEEGEMPEVEAETGTITTDTTTEEIEVPDVDVDVDTQEKDVEVPTLDVNPPEDDS